ncbi:MAG: HAD hydrolase-like protein [Candidatus Limivicinus sp.]|nr:HAD hydrolase-like protein [Candidatus Limivicinus sp.]
MYDCILFDFDGTVFDTVEGITKSVRYALNKVGIDAELESLRCFAGPPLVDKFMEVFGFDRADAEQATLDFRERYNPIGLNECCVFPGIKELLEKLCAAGKTVGIATSKPQELAEELLRREDMLGLFQVICGSRPDGNNSAKWQVVEHAMELCGAAKENTILVGDTKYDVAGAHKVGIACVGVRYGYAAEGELEAAGADAIVEDIPALERFLLG